MFFQLAWIYICQAFAVFSRVGTTTIAAFGRLICGFEAGFVIVIFAAFNTFWCAIPMV